MEKRIIAEFEIGADALLKQATDVKGAIDSIVSKQKELTKSGDTSSQGFIENASRLKSLKSEYNTYTKALSVSLDGTKENSKAQATLNNELGKAAKSIDGARASNKELLKVRNQLNLNTAEGVKAQKEINTQIDSNNKFIKENVSELEQQKIGIGDYGTAITGALESSGLFGSSLKGITTDLKNIIAPLSNAVIQTLGLSKAQQGITSATSKSTKALRIFKVALISTGIGAIVVAIGALVAGFASTQKGADAISKALAPIKGIFQGIIGVVQKLALNFKDIANGAFEQFKDSFTILTSGFVIGANKMRLAWAKVFGSDEEVKQIQEDINTRQREFTEAVERTRGRVDAVKQGFKDAAKEIGEAAKRQSEIVDKTIQLEEANIRFVGVQSELNKNIKEQNKLAEDTNNTLAQREEAAIRSVELSKQLLIEEQKIIQAELDILDLKNAQTDTSREDLQARADLAAKLNTVETAQLELQTTQQNKVNTIRREAQTKREKHLQEVAKKQQEAIKRQEIQLKLFILQNDLENSSLEERIKQTDDVLKKELEIIDAKEKAGLSSNEAEIARIEARNEALANNAQLTSDFANAELELYLAQNQSLLDSDATLNSELLNSKKSFYEERARLQIEALEAEGLSKDLFEAERANIERERDQLKTDADQEAANVKEEQLAEAEALNFENKLLRLEEQDATLFEIQQEIRDRNRQLAIQDVENDVLSESDRTARIAKINRDADNEDKAAKQANAAFKLDVASQTFGNLVTILGKESAAGKAAAIAQATIQTYQSATSAFSSLASIPVVGPALGAIAAAAAIAAGIANVKKITSTKTPKAARGITLKGASHAGGGVGLYDETGNKVVEAEGGENVYAITNKKASSAINQHGLLGALSMINQGIGGGIPLSTPVTYAQSGGLVQSRITQSRDTNILRNGIDERIDNIRVVNIAEDTINVADEAFIVENQANF